MSVCETAKELRRTLTNIETCVTCPGDNLEKDSADVALFMFWANKLFSQLAEEVAAEFKGRPCKVLPFCRVTAQS
jgi:hypothetical protein